MTAGLKALSVHFLTATGAVFAMLALIAATQSDWTQMFLWLLVAFVVDGIDGPLARRYDTARHAPRFDGVLLDLIVDYLTYVFIPAYALFASGLLPGPASWTALFAITFASALYFADTRMKTPDRSFEGFPGCWQMVVLTLFATTPPAGVTLAVIAVLSAAMFLPVRFVHPVRTSRWRPVTLTICTIWTVAAAIAAVTGFDHSRALAAVLGASGLYLLLAGAAQQVLSARE